MSRLPVIHSLTLLLLSTTTSVADDSDLVEFFEKNVRPILIEHCYECHSAEDSEGGLDLESGQAWRQGGDSGPAIQPGDPDHSLVIEAVRYRNRDLQMPPANRLELEQVATLEEWVRSGATDPREPSSNAAAPTGMTVEEGRRFWSLQPVATVSIPRVEPGQWVKTPIDAFVSSRLQAKGIIPAPRADRRTLIRRVTYDLTGLPPTPEEVDRFLADDSPGAFDRLVERLLMSPHYGVRWGRHWLDVARYADSNGLDENLALGNAWRYRDYVIDAMNHDKPFDQFLIEQIAGDLMPGATRESKIATGFLVLGAKVLAEPDREKLEMDTIDEQIDATGKAFLGMTLGCVRCHDHKFDPLKQTDYYALAAIFKSTKTFGDTNTGAIKHWNEHIFASDDELERMKKVDEEIAKLKSAATSFKNRAIASIRDQARGNAAEYLIAATHLEPDASLTEVQRVAAPRDLHPRILHHCRLHLHYNREDEFFGKWHELRDEAVDHAFAVGQYYRPLLADAETALTEARKENAKANTLKDERLEAARKAVYDVSGFLAVPPKPEFALDEETLAAYYELMDDARVFESQAPDVHSAMGVTDREVVAELPIHIRGSHRNLGEPVAREFPEVMRDSTNLTEFPSDASGRLELARWMADPSHPLTSRVYVNRIWRWHFGAGLVRTTENFGVLGDRPSHPRLLDWLSEYFVKSGWSTKQLHRLILSSSVYQMSTRPNGDSAVLATEVDPENRLLWRFNLQRQGPEQIRDSIPRDFGTSRWGRSSARRFRCETGSSFSIIRRSITPSTTAFAARPICQ